MSSASNAALKFAFTHHPREWRDFHYVYPVISRRSKGLSIGVNLNIDKACNFDCIYCSVDRKIAPPRKDTDLAQLTAELDQMLSLAATGEIWKQPPFNGAPPELRRINDIAFSGDGEPTTYPKFDKVCQIAADLKARHTLPGPGGVKLVLITNATCLHRAAVQRGLAVLDANDGEVWAKLDAGTQEYYQLVDRTKTPLKKVLANILACGQRREIVIQSLFMAVHGEPISPAEFEAYLDRLAQLVAGGCRIKLVQVYTTARQTTESYVSALSPEQLDALATRLRARLPQVTAEVYYGVT